MGISRNRTYWPTTGGAVSFQPGWAEGHSTAFIYVNMGFGTIPPNYSHPVVPVFEIVGPSNNEYSNQSVCLPQVPLPANITVKPGDNATIQVVEAAKHGAALYSVSTWIHASSLLRGHGANHCEPVVCGHHLHRRHVTSR